MNDSPFHQPIAPQFLREDGYRTATANERVILALLRKEGSLSRAQLSRLTGLAAHSVTRLVEPLMERGIVQQGEARSQGPGHPSAPLTLNPGFAFTIGISIMTDAVGLILMDFTGNIIGETQAAMPDVALQPALLQLRELVDKLLRENHVSRQRLLGIGIGITGYFIGDGARVNPPVQLDPWALIDLEPLLSAALEAPVWIDNDGNVAAIGEAAVGIGRDVASFAYLYFAAGFGGGVIIDGMPMRGRHGNAGEFASILPLDQPSPTLESLRQMVAAADGSPADLNALIDNFNPDHEGVALWLDQAERALNQVISAISAILDPDAIVLGGRIPEALAAMLIPRLSFINPARRGHHRPVPRIVRSRVTSDAAVVGAASLPLQLQFFSGGANINAGVKLHH